MDDKYIIGKLKALPPGIFGSLDLSFADFVCRTAGCEDSFPLFLGAALVCNATVARKHTCINLENLAGDLNCWFTDLNDCAGEEKELRKLLSGIEFPKEFREKLLLLEKAVGIVEGGKVPFKPLVLDGSFLYIYRDYLSERKLASSFKKMCSQPPDVLSLKTGRITEISPYFKAMNQRPDWQQVAIAAALRNRLTVISGGPGTGKTTVAAAIAALVLEQDAETAILLCAPTGKAQARLQESVKSQFAGFNCSENIKKLLDNLPVSTIHRLLGSRPGSTVSRFNENNLLNAEVVIVDEASMISQRLMKALFAALPEGCKVILLGDMQQLASVESGMVLKDFCQAAGQNRFTGDFIDDCRQVFSPGEILPEPAAQTEDFLANCVVELKSNHRFSSNRGLGLAAAAVRTLPENAELIEVERIIHAMRSDKTGEIALESLPVWQEQKFERAVVEYFNEMQVDFGGQSHRFADYHKHKDVRTAYEMFNKFRFLCVHRRGFYGVHNINRILERHMYEISSGREFYHGKPLIINENCHAMRLYNGDTGMVWTAEDGTLKAFFPPLEEGAEFRCFELGIIPSFSSAYALTVHKSQGSGFQHILVITPDSESPLLTREMIYTAITRAEKRAVIWADAELLTAALMTPTSRCSNLQSALVNQ
ncbi:exodeoxyribonuclease V subunit alpha [Lentisphaerota bacterium ZTH]|nr:exodeoxyribonuclease V subunit alpha [Lentisphaerota bacterium]WET06582.1 exodeoxyribonuclease V subunit alpha [Lentisphaerota bacterium ZTH]